MKFADARRASVDRGGRPCLQSDVSTRHEAARHNGICNHRTRSANVRRCRGLAASLATASFEMLLDVGGCDQGGLA